MDTWVTRTRAEGPQAELPHEFYDVDFLKEFHRRVEYAESLRPSTVLNRRDNHQLLWAENRVIISDKNPDNVALAAVQSALKAMGQTDQLARKIINRWAAARAEIPKIKQRVLN